MKLSDFLPASCIVRDGTFGCLDQTNAMQPQSLAFCQTLEYVQKANANSYVCAVITRPELAREATAPGVATAVNPRLAFFRIYHELATRGLGWPSMAFGRGTACDVNPSAVVSPRARIGDNVTIGAKAVIEDFVEIGDGTYVGPNAVLGAEGLQTIWNEDGAPLVVRHAGGVAVGRGAVILAGAVIAKSLYRRFTRIGDFSQIGILTTIGHGAQIGKRCVISGNCVVAGRAELDDGVWIGVSSSVAPGLHIGAGAQIKMGSILVRNVAPREVVSGNFAMSHNTHMKNYLIASR